MFNNQNNTAEKNMQVRSNENYVKNDTFMNMRLDTSSLIQDIRLFLSSKELFYEETPQGWIQKEQQIGLPLANPEGVLRLCNIVRMRVNQHISQGNFDDDHYWDFITRARKELTETIVKKCYDWGIEDNDLSTVIDEINALIECFMTRPIDNLERESYGQTFSHKEVNNNPNDKGIKGFAGGIGGVQSG